MIRRLPEARSALARCEVALDGNERASREDVARNRRCCPKPGPLVLQATPPKAGTSRAAYPLVTQPNPAGVVGIPIRSKVEPSSEASALFQMYAPTPFAMSS